MGKHARVVRAAGVRSAILALKAEHRAEMQRFPDVNRYLQDHQPSAWARVKECRTRARVTRHVWKHDTYKVRLYSCHVEPWCFACAREAKHGRARKVLDRFAKCTPAGQPLRLAHIVQTAQLRTDGTGWGRRAADDVATFRQVIGRVLADGYGPGYGAFASYQDFGERAFAKTHPHLDLTLNGWVLTDTGPEKTAQYALRNGGHAQWIERTKKHAAAQYLLHTDEIETTFNLQPFVVGAAAYYNSLLYQVRELVDVRKMTYDRARQIIWWANYRANTRERMTVEQFHAGLLDYQLRVGNWGSFQARRLHAGIGHMADHRLEKTQVAMGGLDRPHGRSCQCSECQEWEAVWPDADGDYAFDPWASGNKAQPAVAVP